MNLLFATGLLDNPLLVAVIVIAGAIANWLAKRRQEKQSESQPPRSSPPPPDKPPGEVSLEEILRRLLGGEPQPPPAPPPIPGTRPPQPPPIDSWMDEEVLQPEGAAAAEIQVATAAKPPPPTGTGPLAAARTAGETAPPVVAISQPSHRPPARVERGRGRPAVFWHNPRNARQAFVASVVFAPPKGLQP